MMPTPLSVFVSLLAVFVLGFGPASATMPDAVLSDVPSLEEFAVAEGRSIQVARRGLSFGSTRRPATPSPPAVTAPRAPIDPSPSRPPTPVSAQPNHALPALGAGIVVGAKIERAMRDEDTNAASGSVGGMFGSGNQELLLSALLGVCVFSIVLLFTPMARVFGEPDEAEPERSVTPTKAPESGRGGAAVATAARAGFGRR